MAQARQIVEIVRALAQHRIVEALDAHAHLVLDALPRGFGSQPVRMASRMRGASLVVGEQAGPR